MRLNRTSLGFLAALIGLVGCDGGNDMDAGVDAGDDPGRDSGPRVDSGPDEDPDAGPDGGPDGGSPGVCDDARAIALVAGEQQVTGNTTGMSSELELSTGCGGEPAPREVLELTLPGTGPMHVAISTFNPETPENFDTILEVRPNGCASTEGATCFDDAIPGFIPQSDGEFFADGGDTVAVVVTGFTDTVPPGANSFGAYALDVIVAPANPPTIESADALRVGGARYDVTVTGGDVDGDAVGAILTFLDAEGNPIPVDDDDDPETPDATRFFAQFVDFVGGQETFTARARLENDAVLSATSASTTVRVAVGDQFGLESSTVDDTSITNVTEADRDAACGEGVICADGLECTGALCVTPAATVAACGTATMATLVPGPATVTESVEGTVELGPDNLRTVDCSVTHAGGEGLYRIVVPAGYDLIASTDNEATTGVDTVLYVQTECGNSDTEVACDDDIDFPDNPRTRLEMFDVEPGTYTIVVEQYSGNGADFPLMSFDYQLDVSLRPIIGAGVMCDPLEVMNRCGTGTCPDAAGAVCPPDGDDDEPPPGPTPSDKG